MNDLVGIIRTARGARAGRSTRSRRSRSGRSTLVVEGHRQYNPGWHLALDLRNMLIVSECIAKAALAREESRGGHTRDDFPRTDESGARRTSSLAPQRAGDGVELPSSRCR